MQFIFDFIKIKFYNLESLVLYVGHNQTIYIGLLKRKTNLGRKWKKSDSNIYRANTLQTKPKDSDDVAPFVVTYNPALPRISNILRKQFNMLQYTLLTSANHGLSPLEKCKFSDCVKITLSRVIVSEKLRGQLKRNVFVKKNRPQFSMVYTQL